MRLLNAILDIVFPAHCLSCGKRGAELCENCLISSPEAERESAEWIFPLYDYRHPPIKKSVWLLKYNGKRPLANVFASVMHGRILEELADLGVMQNFRDVILIPIPLSSTRHHERGFNQAELLCRSLIKLDEGKNFNLESSVLMKPKDTVHQAHIENRSERLKNIVGSFSIKSPEKVKDRNIILVDDVTTTGATLTEARKMLREAGAKRVIAFTIAH